MIGTWGVKVVEDRTLHGRVQNVHESFCWFRSLHSCRQLPGFRIFAWSFSSPWGSSLLTSPFSHLHRNPGGSGPTPDGTLHIANISTGPKVSRCQSQQPQTPRAVRAPGRFHLRPTWVEGVAMMHRNGRKCGAKGGWGPTVKYVKPIWAWAVRVQIADFPSFVCGCSCGYGNGREKVDFQRMEVVQVSWWLQLQNEMECRCVAWCCSWEKSKAEPVMTLNISKPWNIWKTRTNHNRTGQPLNRGSRSGPKCHGFPMLTHAQLPNWCTASLQWHSPRLPPNALGHQRPRPQLHWKVRKWELTLWTH